MEAWRMPAKSKAQQHLMAAAAHGAQFPLATKLRGSMSLGQMGDFATTPTKGLPSHVKPGARHEGQYEVDLRDTGPKAQQTRRAPSSDPNHPHRNLGKYLHAKKG